MRYLAALVFLALIAAPAPAQAQFGWGQPFDRSNLSYLPPSATGHWRACTNVDQRYSFEEVTEGCGRLLEQSLNRDDRGSVLWWRALAFEREGQTENAAADFESALATYQEWGEDEEALTEPHLHRASIYFHLRRYDEALAEYALVDRIMPRLTTTHAGRGAIAFVQGNYVLAIAEFDQADRIASRNVSGATYDHLQCEARAAAGAELDVARRACDRSVRDSEGSPRALVARGYFRFRQGDIEGAASDFSRALGRTPDNAAALYGRGVTSIRLGRAAEGEADIARARQLNSAAVDYHAGAGLVP